MADGGSEGARISIIGQIAEIDREIALRKGVYPRQVGAGKMRQSEADMLMARIEAVRRTLVWCHNNEADIRAYVREKQAGAGS